MTIWDGMFTGLVIGIVLSTPAFVAELLHHRSDLPLLVDVKSVWGKEVPSTDVLTWSMVLYLALAMAFGGLYPGLVTIGLVDSFDFVSIAVYTVVFYLVVGLLASPALGLGPFGRREGALVWLELLISHVFFGIGFWYAANFVVPS